MSDLGDSLNQDKSEHREPGNLPDFDPDLHPTSEQNVRAAEARGWDFYGGFYVDDEGCLMADEFGQPL